MTRWIVFWLLWDLAFAWYDFSVGNTFLGAVMIMFAWIQVGALLIYKRP